MKERVFYIDYLKAFAIFLVVVGHVVSYIWGIDNHKACTLPIYTFIYSFHMPLFICLSGLCTGHVTASKIWGKAKVLLYPYIVWSLIRCAFYGDSVYNRLILTSHGGFWFLLCLFEIFLIFYVFHRCERFVIDKVPLRIVYWAFSIAFVMGVCYIFRGTIYETALGLDMLYIHYKFFVLGYLFNKLPKLMAFVNNAKCYAVSFMVFCVLIVTKITISNVPFGGVINPLVATMAIFILLHAFQNFNITSPSIRKGISIVGTHTLEIYILHSFLLDGLTTLTEPLSPHADNYVVVSLLSSVLACCCIGLCLLICKFTHLNIYLKLLLYGRK